MNVSPDQIGPNGKMLIEYWKSLVTNNQIPRWDQIKISGISPFVSRVVAYEATGDGDALIIFSGNEVDLRLRLTVAGRNARSISTPREQDKVIKVSATSLFTPCGAINDFYYRGSLTEPIKRGLNTLVPFLNDNNEPRILMQTDDWLDEDIEEDQIRDPERPIKTLGYVTMIDHFDYFDLGFGLPKTD